jgi:hypothetical protein
MGAPASLPPTGAIANDPRCRGAGTDPCGDARANANAGACHRSGIGKRVGARAGCIRFDGRGAKEIAGGGAASSDLAGRSPARAGRATRASRTIRTIRTIRCSARAHRRAAASGRAAAVANGDQRADRLASPRRSGARTRIIA